MSYCRKHAIAYLIAAAMGATAIGLLAGLHGCTAMIPSTDGIHVGMDRDDAVAALPGAVRCDTDGDNVEFYLHHNELGSWQTVLWVEGGSVYRVQHRGIKPE